MHIKTRDDKTCSCKFKTQGRDYSRLYHYNIRVLHFERNSKRSRILI